jgi:hypothetical protein
MMGNDFNRSNSGNFSGECCQNQHSKLNLNSNILPVRDKLSSTSFRLLKRKNCESKIIFETLRGVSSQRFSLTNMKGGRK